MGFLGDRKITYVFGDTPGTKPMFTMDTRDAFPEVMVP